MMFVENYHYVVWNRQHIIPIKISLCKASVENINWSLCTSSNISYNNTTIKIIDRLQELQALRNQYQTEILYYTNKLRSIDQEISECISFRMRKSILI